jgi:hypothetical protein
VCDRIAWSQLTGNDRLPQRAPVGFDVPAWELLWPLGALLEDADAGASLMFSRDFSAKRERCTVPPSFGIATRRFRSGR